MKLRSGSRFLWTLGFLFASVFAAAEPAAPEAISPQKQIELFDGKTLTGWKFVAKSPDFDAASIWSVQDGVIRCLGKPSGYARTLDAYRDYELHFEWRWPGDKGGNSGVFVHLNPPDKVWPTCLEIQLKAGDAGSVRANGGSRVRELDAAAKDPINVSLRAPGKEKPPGEWNACDVVCRGDTVVITVNGVLENKVTGASVSSGAIALQAEGAPVEFRSIHVKPLSTAAAKR
jgi:hypothetical protein